MAIATPPAGYFDILDYLVLKDWKTSSVDGSYDVLTTPDANGRFFRYRLKGYSCTKFDISVVTNDAVYDRCTTLDDGNPKNFKVHGDIGYKMFPRFIPGGLPFRYETLIPNASFDMYKDCKKVSHNSLGDAKQVLSGIFYMVIGGDMGMNTVPCLMHEWFYNGSNGVYKSLERNIYALGFGWVSWNLLGNYKDGMLYWLQTTKHTRIVKGAPPKFTFPCPGIVL